MTDKLASEKSSPRPSRASLISTIFMAVRVTDRAGNPDGRGTSVEPRSVFMTELRKARSTGQRENSDRLFREQGAGRTCFPQEAVRQKSVVVNPAPDGTRVPES